MSPRPGDRVVVVRVYPPSFNWPDPWDGTTATYVGPNPNVQFPHVVMRIDGDHRTRDRVHEIAEITE